MNPSVSFAHLRLGYSRMLTDDQIRRVALAHEKRRERVAAIRSRGEAEAYRAEVRRKITRLFGRFPRRTPLNARVTGTIRERGLRVEHLLVESRPGFLVSANLYLPGKLKGKAPAVLGNCGHNLVGKAGATNQLFAQELASDGFVVLVFDPLAQGERDLYTSLRSGHLLRRVCSEAHNMMGKKLQLAGEFLGAWMVWDGMRCLDYLLSRPEVDPTRVGVTGNSGGGVLSTWLWALEPRLTMAAPSCFITTTLCNARSETAGDAEQSPPGLLAAGLGLADFLIARAPEPALVISQRLDFFDHRGADEVTREVRRFYRLLGAPERFGWFLGEHPHGFYPDGRHAMRRFFCTMAHLGEPQEFQGHIRPPEELFATRTGRVRDEGGRTVEEWLRELPRPAAPPRSPEQLAKVVARLLHLPRYRSRPVEWRNLRGDWVTAPNGVKWLVGRYAIATTDGIDAILRKVMPPRADGGLAQALEVEKELLLYLPHWSAQAELEAGTLARSLMVQPPLYAVDVRGFGESICMEGWDLEAQRWLEYQAQTYEAFLGQTLLGQRVFDLLRTCDLLTRQGAERIRVVARGQGALVATFAALLTPAITAVDLYETPENFASWLEAAEVPWPYANCPPGFLRESDLPECYAALGQRARICSYWSATQCLPFPGVTPEGGGGA